MEIPRLHNVKEADKKIQQISKEKSLFHQIRILL